MTIETDYKIREWIVSCNECGEELGTFSMDEYNFQEVVDEIKINDWQIQKVNEEWEHLCPICKEILR